MLTLKAEKRDIFGKKLFAARNDGRVPAVVYGMGIKPLSVFVPAVEFKKVWKTAGESSIVSIVTPDGEHDTLIHDVSFHPVTGEPLHADFYAIDTSKPIEVSVPLVFEGVSPAVKSLGGILIKVLHELKIKVLPKELPHSLVVDLSTLETLNSQIAAKDIALPSSASLVTHSEEIVAIVSAPKEEEEETAPIDLESIEVEKKGKKEEETSADESQAA